MSDVFVDSSANALTITNNDPGSGGATYNTAYTAIGLGAVNYVGGAFLTTPMVPAIDVSAGDFTVEMRVLDMTYDPLSFFFNLGDGSFESGVNLTPDIVSGVNVITANVLQVGGHLATISSTVPLDDTIWNAIAVVLNGTTLSLYINGVSVASTTITSLETPLTGQFSLGGPLTGGADELRISNIARYTSNYVPATLPFVADANTALLMHFEPPIPSTPTVDVQAGFAGPRIGNAVLLADAGNINPRIYPPKVDVTARVLPPRILS